MSYLSMKTGIKGQQGQLVFFLRTGKIISTIVSIFRFRRDLTNETKIPLCEIIFFSHRSLYAFPIVSILLAKLS